MTAHDYNHMVQETYALAQSIVEAKRPSYTIASADILANFKGIASRMGLKPEQVCMVYLLKHLDALTAMVGRGVPDPELDTRIADCINYLHLLKANLRESCSNAEMPNAA